MRLLFIKILLLVGLYSFAQPNDFNTYYGIFMEGYNNKNLSKMKEGSESLIQHFPDEFAGYYLHSFYQMCTNNLNEAQVEIDKAYNIDPLSPYPYMVQSYLYSINNQIDVAEKNMYYAVQLRSHNSLNDIYNDISVLEHFTQKDFTALKSSLTKITNDGVMNPTLAREFDQCFIGASKGTPCNTVDALAAKFNALKNPNPIINKIVPFTKAINFYTNGNVVECLKQFDVFLNLTKNDKSLAWKRSYIYWFRSILKNDSYDERGALLDINSALEEYKILGFASFQLASIELHKIHVLKSFGDKQQEKLQMAYQLEQTANKLNSDYFKAKAYNSIGAYHLMDGTQADKAKSGEYLTKAYNLAKNVNDVYLTREVNANYIIIKAKQGLYADAERITEETAQGYIKDGIFDEAQNLYNNLGFIFYNRNDYQNAIVQFEKVLR